MDPPIAIEEVVAKKQRAEEAELELGISKNRSFGVCLSSLVSTMDSEAMSEAQKKQVEPFSFDNPHANEDLDRMVSLIAELEVATEDVIGITTLAARAGNDFVFVSDLMDFKRELDSSGSGNRVGCSGEFGVREHDGCTNETIGFANSLHDSDMNLDNLRLAVGDVAGKIGGPVKNEASSIDSGQNSILLAAAISGIESMLDRDDFFLNHHDEEDCGVTTSASVSGSNCTEWGARRGESDGGYSFADVRGGSVSDDVSNCLTADHDDSMINDESQQLLDKDHSSNFIFIEPKRAKKLRRKKRGAGFGGENVAGADRFEDCDSEVQVGGAKDSNMGSVVGGTSKLASEGLQTLNRFVLLSDVGDKDAKEAVDISVGNSESVDQSLPVPVPLTIPTSNEKTFPVSKSQKKVQVKALRLKRTQRRKAALEQRKRIVAELGGEEDLEKDVLFKGYPPLSENECFKELDQDKSKVFAAFQSLVKQCFPSQCSPENSSDATTGQQLIYMEEGEGDIVMLQAFTSNLREKLKQGKVVWLVLDTGANEHVVKDVALLGNKRQTFHRVTGVSGDETKLECIGDLSLDLVDENGTSSQFSLKGAFGLSKCPFNLLSVSKLLDQKFCVHLDGEIEEHYLQLPRSQIRIPIKRDKGLLMLPQVISNVQDGGELVSNTESPVILSSSVDTSNKNTSIPSFNFNKVDYGMAAPLHLWHLRHHSLSVQQMKKLHDANSKHLKLSKSNSNDTSNSSNTNTGASSRRNTSSNSETNGTSSSEGSCKVVIDESLGTSDGGKIEVDPAEFDDRAARRDEPLIYGFHTPRDDQSLKRPKCDVCRQAKMRRKAQRHATLFPEPELLQGRVFSTDLKSSPYRDFNGRKQVICFVEHVEDGIPGITFHYVMKNKSETTAMLKRFINDCKLLGIKIAKIQSDRGTEYFEQEGIGTFDCDRARSAFTKVCTQNNIIHTVTPVGDKEKLAERWIKEHFKTVDTMLWNARLTPQLWSHALAYEAYQHNRTPVEVKGVWYKAPLHYWTGEVPRWDKFKVFGCDAYSMIPNNKFAKYPGIPTAQRSIFVGFDKNGGFLLFDLNKRRVLHSSNVYFNESFDHRHNALHYFDQRRALLKKGESQPVQVNDFDAVDAMRVRNLYMSPDLLQAASIPSPLQGNTSSQSSSRISSSSAGMGGVEANGGRNSHSSSDISAVGSVLNEKHEAEKLLVEHETNNSSVRPLRIEPVGTKQRVWTREDRQFLQQAELHNYPVVMLQPCPKIGDTKSSRRYKASMLGSTIKEIKELGSTSGDIDWNYRHGYLQFPGHESKRVGHVFTANTQSSHLEADISLKVKRQWHKKRARKTAFNHVLEAIDEEIRDDELNTLIENKLEMLKFAEMYGEKLMALTTAVKKPTLSEYVDWHIAAEPTHYNETMQENCSEFREWEAAMNEEIASMNRFDVFDEVTLSSIPRDRQVLGCKWVYKRKRDKDGNIVRYRARVVALGFRQRAYDSFVPEETHSPVVSKDTLRLFLSICARQNLTIYQADVKAAFLQAPLTEEIYMKPPPGYRNKNGQETVWRLKKAVYGLKQASACFWTAVNQHLVSIGFHSLTGDPCLFQKRLSNGKKMYVCCYVDDITYAVEDESDGQKFLQDMRSRFFIGEDEGNPIEWLLGMAIKQDIKAGTVSLNMASMIDKLANLVLDDCERVKALDVRTPMCVTPLVKLAEREVSQEEFDYLSVVGSLLHIANCVRCDVAFAVGCLARYSMTPGKAHVKAAKRVVQYLYATKTLGITYYRDSQVSNAEVSDANKVQVQVYENGLHPCDQEKDRDLALTTFGDSDYAMDYTRKSTMGIVIMLNGGPISWTSVLGKTVATSTCEAEVNAAVVAVKDSVHFKLMLQELGLMDSNASVQILEDNSACIAQAEGGIHHVRNAKHYEVKLRFLQQKVMDKEVEFIYCATNNQLADFFTKPLDEDKFLGFRRQMMSDIV